MPPLPTIYRRGPNKRTMAKLPKYVVRGKKVKKDPNAPKKSMGAFMFFAADARKEPSVVGLNFLEKGKEVGRLWNDMADGKKRKYVDMALADRDRYAGEMNEYIPSAAHVAKQRAPLTLEPDPDAPSKGRTPYKVYCDLNRARVEATMPGALPAKVKEQLSTEWKNKDAAGKVLCEATAKEEKLAYEQAVLHYRPSEDYIKAMNYVQQLAPSLAPALNVAPRSIADIPAKDLPAFVIKGKRAKKDPNEPKRGSSAFLLFATDTRPQLSELSFMDSGRKLGEMWKVASPEVRSKYETLAKADKARYRAELEAYRPSKDYLQEQEKSRMPKLAPDPDAPKAPLTAYRLYRNANEDKFGPAGEVKTNDTRKKMREAWEGLSPEERTKFEQQAKVDKVEYDEKMKTYVPSEAYLKAMKFIRQESQEITVMAQAPEVSAWAFMGVPDFYVEGLRKM